MKIIHEFTLDVSRTGTQVTIPITQHETVHRLVIRLRNGSKAISLDETVSAVLYLDTDAFELVTVYTENGAFPNSFVYDVSAYATSTVGEHAARLQIYKDKDTILYSPDFSLMIRTDITNGSQVLSSPPYAAVILAKEEAEAQAHAAEISADNVQKAVENFPSLEKGTGINSIQQVDSLANGDYSVATGAPYNLLDFSTPIVTTAKGKGSRAHGGGVQTLSDASSAEGINTVAGSIELPDSTNQVEIYTALVSLVSNEHTKKAIAAKLQIDESLVTVENILAQGIDMITAAIQEFGGFGSHSEGLLTEARGTGSHAEGVDTGAYGLGSHTEGNETKAYSKSSHAEGTNTKAIGTDTHAEGADTIAEGWTAHVEGWETYAKGAASHAEGGFTSAAGKYTHVEGKSNIGYTSILNLLDDEELNEENIKSLWETDKFLMAFGNYSHAEGVNTLATGEYGSHAEGVETIAAGNQSHAECYRTQALGYSSHAEGVETVAQGHGSHAGGKGTKATADYQTAIGKFNKENADALFIVGNGTTVTRSNAFEVLNNGTVYANGKELSTKDYVDSKDDLFVQNREGTASYACYTITNGKNSTVGYTVNPDGGAIAKRDDNGTLKAADPVTDDDLATKKYVDSELAKFDFIKVVDVLPDAGLPNKIYFVPKGDPHSQDLFDEYIWVNNDWEWITTHQLEVDLTPYATYEYVDNSFITKYYADSNLATKLYVDDAIQQAFANIARAEGVSF